MHKLRCFSDQPHPQHQWTFYYMDPPTDYICPGLKDEEDG